MPEPKVIDWIAELDNELLTCDGFDEAIIGVAAGWFNHSQDQVVAYDYEKCVDILVAKGMDREEASEFLDFNTCDAYMGPKTPVFIHRPPKDL